MTAKKTKTEKPGILVKLATYVVEKWKAGIAVWLALLIGGGYIYAGVIQREGFPPISFPITLISGTYVVDDEVRVDTEVAQPIAEALGDEVGITKVETAASSNFFTVQVSFDDTLTSEAGTELVQTTISEQANLPAQAQLNYVAIDPASYLFEYDLLVQVYSTNNKGYEATDSAADYVARQLVSLDEVDRADPQPNFEMAANPLSGESGVIQSSFSRYGEANDSGMLEYYQSTVIGVDGTENGDIIALSNAVREQLDSIDLSGEFEGIELIIGADFASNIDSQINFLESNMLTGLIAVSLVSLLLITWRASIITALFMITVMLATIVILYFVGYTLNTITLFALILSLGLFVDDATIVVEAIDVSKRKRKMSNIAVIGEAIRRVGTASLSGTLTTVLVFAILATPTGILGEFIRLIPITVVIALLVSFVFSMTLIPLLSKFLILRHRDPSWITQNNPLPKFEEWLAVAMERNVLTMKKGGKLRAAIALSLSGVLVLTGFYMFGFLVDQNTFPPAKDTNQIGVEIIYAPGTTIVEAEEIAESIENIVNETIGEYVLRAYYGIQQPANNRQALLSLELVPFTDRDVKSPLLVEELEDAIAAAKIPASVTAAQVDNGPPSTQFPFGLRVYSESTKDLQAATKDFQKTLVGEEMESFNGETVTILDSRVYGVEGEIIRENGKRYASVRFAYDNDNPTIVSMLTEELIDEKYPDDASLAAFNVTKDDVVPDAGQEGEFQDSFNTLLLAIPIALLLMYVLLAVQFRSILQPFLILLAIPFTLFGVAGGLYVTDNAASFFALTGFIGLIGIAVNNTIMLTDYANQERRAGLGAIDAIAAASRKRLRPLIATSLTTVVALLPLALSDPFWEALAFTIIFGLLSSTFLVIISFPYYYLLLEWIRRKTSSLLGRS